MARRPSGPKGKPARKGAPKGRAKLRRLARDVFSFERFHPEQEALLCVLGGHDTLVVMPTGAGKSAIYQLAALMLDGPTVVVSPLIALQRDQVEALSELGAGAAQAAALNSTLGEAKRRDLLERLEAGGLEFLFLAPEQLGADETLARLKEAKPSLFVVDEAHCVDAYYQEIGRAGRDGKHAHVRLFYRPEDLKLQRFFAGATPPPPEKLEGIARRVAGAEGPVAPAELEDDVGLSSRRLLTALNRLEEVGALELDPNGEAVSRADAPEPVEAAKEAQERFKLFEASRLEMIRGYAETEGCRRAYLLSYFGEAFEPPCGHCDNCRAGHGVAEGEDHGEPFPIGSRVTHKSFGEGQIMRYEEAKVVVLFDEIGYQTLSLELVREKGLLGASD